MCGRFALDADVSEIAARFHLPTAAHLDARYNIAPSQQIAAIRLAPSAGQRELVMLCWGLIPAWAKDKKIGNKLINARAETVAAKPSFRAAFARRRCLIPASGFFEWQQTGTGKQPYFIKPRQGLFALAGLWERWQSPEGPVESCTILTTTANEAVAPIHDRMPVILPAAGHALWLAPQSDRAALTALLVPIAATEMTAYPVSSLVNNPKNNSAACVAPLAGSTGRL